ncbi:hypothetical protein ACPCHT_11515 [Nucisporomicrobium flavum]|uniref:hypothetical protein n=1 Tax=Nucisporomicrobium flavum TaxID=2785915 RepID=UPI003C2FAB2E
MTQVRDKSRLGRVTPAVVAALAVAGALPAPGFAQAGTGSARQWRFISVSPVKGTGNLHAVAARSATDAWAVGWTNHPDTGAATALAERWTGTGWQAVPAPASAGTQSWLSDVDVLPSGDAVAVGRELSGDVSVPLIERYPAAGGPGEVVPGPEPAVAGAWQGVSLSSATDGWAVGQAGSGSPGDPAKAMIARWDGTRWSRVPSPGAGTSSSRLTAVVAVSPSDAWAVGGLRDAGTPDVDEALVLHWDGVSWSRVDGPAPSPGGTTLLGVAAAGPGEVWAVGRTGPESQPRAVALHRTHGVWQELRSTRAAATQFSDVAVVAPGDVELAGYQVPFTEETVNLEHWTGAGLEPDSTLVGPAGDDHIASALSGIAAEPAGGRLWAVGWATTVTRPVMQPVTLRSDR